MTYLDELGLMIVVSLLPFILMAYLFSATYGIEHSWLEVLSTCSFIVLWFVMLKYSLIPRMRAENERRKRG